VPQTNEMAQSGDKRRPGVDRARGFRRSPERIAQIESRMFVKGGFGFWGGGRVEVAGRLPAGLVPEWHWRTRQGRVTRWWWGHARCKSRCGRSGYVGCRDRQVIRCTTLGGVSRFYRARSRPG
jgi:hypothetical protein